MGALRPPLLLRSLYSPLSLSLPLLLVLLPLLLLGRPGVRPRPAASWSPGTGSARVFWTQQPWKGPQRGHTGAQSHCCGAPCVQES